MVLSRGSHHYCDTECCFSFYGGITSVSSSDSQCVACIYLIVQISSIHTDGTRIGIQGEWILTSCISASYI